MQALTIAGPDALRRSLALALVGTMALTGCADSHGDDVSVIDLEAMVDLYSGAEVLVEGVPGVVGTDTELEVRPAIVGDRFDVLVREGAVEESLTVEFALDLETLGVDPDRAVSHWVQIVLLRRSDGSCQMSNAGHRIDQSMVWGDYPPEMFARCGAFAP